MGRGRLFHFRLPSTDFGLGSTTPVDDTYLMLAHARVNDLKTWTSYLVARLLNAGTGSVRDTTRGAHNQIFCTPQKRHRCEFSATVFCGHVGSGFARKR